MLAQLSSIYLLILQLLFSIDYMQCYPFANRLDIHEIRLHQLQHKLLPYEDNWHDNVH